MTSTRPRKKSALTRVVGLLFFVVFSGIAVSEEPATEKRITSMGVALDPGCSAAGCANLDCTNKFLAGVNFYYGITSPQNTRVAYKFFKMAQECGDKRAGYFMAWLDTNGHIPESQP